MKTAAVIAEYNPFHKGHQWQIEQIRAQGATHIVAVMSPDFTQRGTPAVFPKRIRAAAAMECGVDLVLELPVCYACSTAQRFAFGAVQLVSALGCVDLLAFGAEDADVLHLTQAAQAIEDKRVAACLKQELAQGITFAKARENAVGQIFGEETARILQQPNNILAVEYLSQLSKTAASGKRPVPLPIARIGNSHDGAPQEGFASASYLRRQIINGEWEKAEPYLPDRLIHRYRAAAQSGQTASMQTGERAVLSALRRMSLSELKNLPDLSEGIENRLYRAIRSSCSTEQLYEQIKTKRYPLSRVRRLVLSAFLQIPAQMAELTPPYLRILGMNERGREILSLAKQTAVLPVSASLAKLSKHSPQAAEFAALEVACADQYSLFCGHISPCGGDFSAFCKG